MKKQVRFLVKDDIPKLIQLEKKQWSADQLPTEQILLDRINTYPELCVGVFCMETNTALASLFAKPTCDCLYTRDISWYECASVEPYQHNLDRQSIFGISLTSVDAGSANDVFIFLYPYLLKKGYRYGYLGSPIPGLAKAKQAQPDLCPIEYTQRKHPLRSKEPYDPQLNYYYRKGFHTIVSVQKNYFPHKKSLDYGVIIRGKIPLAEFFYLWKHLPISWIVGLRNVYTWWVRYPDRLKSTLLPGKRFS